MANFYISPTGNDGSGDGSTGNPWLTLTQANLGSSDSDIIILKDGTYSWDSIGNMDSLRTYQAENTLSAILDGEGSEAQMSIGSSLGNVTVTGIRFTNVVNANDRVFEFTTSTTQTVTLSKCQFDNITAGGSGFKSQLFQGINQDLILESCLIYSIDLSQTGFRPSLFELSTDRDLTLISCTIAFDTTTNSPIEYVFGWGNGIGSITVTNCIISRFHLLSVTWATTSGRTFILSHNCFYQLTSVPSGTSIITSDPLFIDYTNFNFNLRPTSPCIETGTAI